MRRFFLLLYMCIACTIFNTSIEENVFEPSGLFSVYGYSELYSTRSHTCGIEHYCFEYCLYSTRSYARVLGVALRSTTYSYTGIARYLFSQIDCFPYSDGQDTDRTVETFFSNRLEKRKIISFRTAYTYTDGTGLRSINSF